MVAEMRAWDEELPVDQFIHGDCLEEMRQLPSNSISAIVTDPPYGLGEVKDIAGLLQAWCRGEDGKEYANKKGKSGLLTRSLNSCIGFTMAWLTQRYKIAESIGLLVSLKPKEAKRYFMMNVFTWFSTVLASMIISFHCLAALCVPVGASFIWLTSNPLGVLLSYAVLVSTFTTTIFASTFSAKFTVEMSEQFAAVQADDFGSITSLLYRLHMFILAGNGAMLTSSMLGTRSITQKRLTTGFTDELGLAPNRVMGRWFSRGKMPKGQLTGYNITHGKGHSFSSCQGVLQHRSGKTLLPSHYTMKQPLEQDSEVLAW